MLIHYVQYSNEIFEISKFSSEIFFLPVWKRLVGIAVNFSRGALEMTTGCRTGGDVIFLVNMESVETVSQSTASQCAREMN